MKKIAKVTFIGAELRTPACYRTKCMDELKATILIGLEQYKLDK